MVVEDDETVRLLLARAFRDVGHDLLVAASAEEALATWAEHDGAIDAIVSDVIMPNMSGPAMVAELRKQAPLLPVVYISGYAADRVGNDAIENSRTVFMQKPFDLRGLVTTLARLLEPEDSL